MRLRQILFLYFALIMLLYIYIIKVMAEPIRVPDNISARISNLYNNPRMKLLMDELLYSAEILSVRLRLYQQSREPREITRIPERTRLAESRDTAGTIHDYLIQFRNVIVPPVEQGIVLPNMTDQETVSINEMKDILDHLVGRSYFIYTFLTSLANGSITPNMQPDGVIRTKNQMMEPYSRLARELYNELKIFREMIQPRPVVMGTTYSIIPIGRRLAGKTMKVKKRRKIRKQKKTKRTNQKKFIKYK